MLSAKNTPRAEVEMANLGDTPEHDAVMARVSELIRDGQAIVAAEMMRLHQAVDSIGT